MTASLRDKKIPMGQCQLCAHDLRITGDGELRCSNTGCTNHKRPVKLRDDLSVFKSTT